MSQHSFKLTSDLAPPRICTHPTLAMIEDLNNNSYRLECCHCDSLLFTLTRADVFHETDRYKEYLQLLEELGRANRNGDNSA